LRSRAFVGRSHDAVFRALEARVRSGSTNEDGTRTIRTAKSIRATDELQTRREQMEVSNVQAKVICSTFPDYYLLTMGSDFQRTLHLRQDAECRNRLSNSCNSIRQPIRLGRGTTGRRNCRRPRAHVTRRAGPCGTVMARGLAPARGVLPNSAGTGKATWCRSDTFGKEAVCIVGSFLRSRPGLPQRP
jgi:hypothetical protein